MRTLLILLLSLCAQAQETWTKADTAWELSYQLVALADWAQTRNISRNPERITWTEVWVFNADGSSQSHWEPHQTGWKELNPLLGSEPSTQKVDAYFAASGILHYAVARWLSPRNRRTYQAMTIGFEAAIVARNLKMGIRIRW